MHEITLNINLGNLHLENFFNHPLKTILMGAHANRYNLKETNIEI